MLSVALDHLRLPANRRSRVIPLIEDTLDGRRSPAVDRWAAAGLDQRALELIRVDAAVQKNFSEFAAFDLSMDEATTAALAGVRDAVTTTDGQDVWLGCTLALARIEPNPITVGSLLARAVPVIQGFVRDNRWQDATRWLARMSDVAASADAARPDVAAAVRDVLRQFCDRAMLLQLARACGADGASTCAPLTVAALGAAIVPCWLDALATPANRALALRLRPFMCECGPQMAPALAVRLPDLGSDAAIVAVAVLGYAGSGYETPIAERMTNADDALSREALRALARVGSSKAAALIAWQIEHGTGAQAAAEEALWRLAPPLALVTTRELLARREFVARHPRAAARLLERAAHSSDSQLESVLETLARLRFHFWNPALARVGAKARDLM